MGMYTELNIALRLEKDTPKEIINALQYMLGEDAEVPFINHPLFNTESWKVLLIKEISYFPGDSFHLLSYNDKLGYDLTVRSSIKNYDNEIELFLDFINPYIETEGFIGYMFCEQCDDPTLIYYVNGEIQLR